MFERDVVLNKYQVVFITVLVCISVVIFLIPAIVFCAHRMMKSSDEAYIKNHVSHMLVFSVCLISSVWCLRYAVGCYEIFTAEGTSALTWWEEIFNSIVHALQTFSLDEDYDTYIINGKMMLQDIFGSNTVWQNIYGMYASILNFISPIAGGTVIFDIIASIFPKVKLYISHFVLWKEKYYFSELNGASLALAKSFLDTESNYFKKPIMIFTDAYIDDKDERSSEIFLEAKSLGFICVRDDLAYIKKNRFGMRQFFLMDEAEQGNLQTLAELANQKNSIYLKKSEIYFFTNDDAYVQLGKRIYDKLNFKKNELPIFIPVQSYRNLISNLLVQIPLYEPLIGKKRNKDGTQDLIVTIVGIGNIGTEMFLATYWFGQILNCNLKINIISHESEDKFWSRIDYINPEIRHTTIKGDPILQINRKGDMADEYCKVRYIQCDVKSSRFIACLTEAEEQILKTDYFLISLGNDEDNISVANTVRKYVGEYHIALKEPIRTVITYVVYDVEISNTLNRKKYFRFVNDKVDVYMQAIGNLSEIYSVSNIFMEKPRALAQRAQDAYNAIQNRSHRVEKSKERIEDEYKYWADLSRGMHVRCQIYSMGLITVSLFDYPDSKEKYEKELNNIYEEYKKRISGDFKFDSPEHEEEHLSLLHKMAWLEHRRWNAFTRSKGFRQTDDYDVYAVSGVNGSYKQMDIKLHPCLVECDKNGIKATISSKGVIDESTLLKCTDRTDFDLLDDLSYDLYEKKYNNYDFKQYDYPIY